MAWEAWATRQSPKVGLAFGGHGGLGGEAGGKKLVDVTLMPPAKIVPSFVKAAMPSAHEVNGMGAECHVTPRSIEIAPPQGKATPGTGLPGGFEKVVQSMKSSLGLRGVWAISRS